MSKRESRTKNSVFNIASGFSIQIIKLILNFVTRTVFIKTLGVSYLGINGLFSDILSLLSLAELGFDTAISFRLYKPIANQDDVKVRQYLKLFKTIYKVVGLIILGTGIILIPFLPYLIKDYDSLGKLGISAAFIFVLYLLQNVSTYLFMAYRSIVVKANQKQHLLDFVGFGITVFYNIAKIVVLLTVCNFTVYILTTTFFYILQNLINAYVATKKYPQYFVKEKTTLSVEERKDLYKDCGALLVYKINNVVIKATDNIGVSSFVGLTIVGLYSNYLVIYQALYSILHILFRSVKASMGDLFTTDDMSKKYFFFEVMNFLAIIFFGTAAAGVAVEANEVIKIWLGDKFVVPQPLPILIGIEMMFAGLKLNLAQIRNVSGIFKQMWFRPVIGAIINVVSSVILVQFWGIAGVITGTILAAVFANFMVDPRAIHKYSFNNYKPSGYYYRKNITFIAVLCLVVAGDLFICNTFCVGHGILSLVVHILICGISVPLAFITLYWKSKECVYLRHKALAVIRRRKSAH